jgi:hypothetical protein
VPEGSGPDFEMLARAVLTWLLLLVIAVGTAVLREGLLAPQVGPAAAHVIGTLVVVAIFLRVIARSARWIVPGLEPLRLLRLGAGWTAATILFEFGFGRFGMGYPWSRLLHDYNVLEGRVWILVLLTTLLGPWLLGRRRGGRASSPAT